MEQLASSKNYIRKIYYGTVFILSLTLYGCHTTGGAKIHPHIKGDGKEIEPPEENKYGSFKLEKHSAKNEKER